MTSHSDRSQSGEEIDELEDLIRQSEAAIETVTELIQDLAGDHWQYLEFSSSEDQLNQTQADPSILQQKHFEEHRESGIFELTEPGDSGDRDEVKGKRELSKEEIFLA